MAREAKDPEADYRAALYVAKEGWTGIPANGFKAALVNTCRLIDDFPMTLAKRILYVRTQGFTENGIGLIKIEGKHYCWESKVRLNPGTADIRFRPRYDNWGMTVEIEFLRNLISREMLCNLLELCGWAEGLCEHRPGSPVSNTGSFGRFEICKE